MPISYPNTGGGASTTKVYRALLSQSGTADPVATVLENSLGGDVVWTRNGAGEYRGTLVGAFTDAKTFIPPLVYTNIGNAFDAIAIRNSVHDVEVTSYDSGTLADGILNPGGVVEILVYP